MTVDIYESKYLKDVENVRSLFDKKGVEPTCARAMAEVVVICRKIGFRWMMSMILDVWNELEVVESKRKQLAKYPEGNGVE